MNNTLNTTKDRKKVEVILKSQIEALSNAIEKASSKDMLPLMMIKDEKDASLTFLMKSKTWNFNFVGGGWNTSHGIDKEEAIQNAITKHESDTLKVDRNSFRIETEADTKNLLSLFH